MLDDKIWGDLSQLNFDLNDITLRFVNNGHYTTTPFLRYLYVLYKGVLSASVSFSTALPTLFDAKATLTQAKVAQHWIEAQQLVRQSAHQFPAEYQPFLQRIANEVETIQWLQTNRMAIGEIWITAYRPSSDQLYFECNDGTRLFFRARREHGGLGGMLERLSQFVIEKNGSTLANVSLGYSAQACHVYQTALTQPQIANYWRATTDFLLQQPYSNDNASTMSQFIKNGENTILPALVAGTIPH